MIKRHHKTLKFHAVYSAIVAIIFIGVLIVSKDIILGLVMLFLLIYVGGNGIIHSKTNQLHRDSIVEYVLVSLIILVVISSAIIS